MMIIRKSVRRRRKMGLRSPILIRMNRRKSKTLLGHLNANLTSRRMILRQILLLPRFLIRNSLRRRSPARRELSHLSLVYLKEWLTSDILEPGNRPMLGRALPATPLHLIPTTTPPNRAISSVQRAQLTKINNAKTSSK